MGMERLMDPSHINWIKSTGPDGDIVISSRIRLARNLSNIPFPHLLSKTKAQEIIGDVAEAFRGCPTLSKEAELFPMGDLSVTERLLLSELHLISPAMVDIDQGAVIVTPDESIGIMINEEDHLRIQTMFPGLAPLEAFELASRVDDVLEDKLDFAFDEKIGYLTSCPTNVGTGLRASVMLHLPVLTMLEQVGPMLATISQVGLVVRGLYGEGTQSRGNLYQISNQITLGKSEEDIIQNVIGVAKQIINSERRVRQNLSEEAKIRLEDKILRSYGVLSNAKLISSQEAMAYISDVRLGVEMGVIPHLTLEDLNALFIAVGPAYIQGMTEEQLTPQERDLKRADIIRRKLTK